MNTRDISDLAADSQSQWTGRARYFNSGNAFALTLPAVPSVQFTEQRDRAFDPASPTGLIDLDLSDQMHTDFPATTPLVMSRYLRIRAGDSLAGRFNASAQTLCVLTGQGSTRIDGQSSAWSAGDIMLLPGDADIEHSASDDAVIWQATDEPVLAFLGLQASANQLVEPVFYPAAELERELQTVYEHPDRDSFAGYAVVLSNQSLQDSRNIHPTMTLALNSLPPESAQPPHKHNSMALTLCIQGDDCYSLIDGEKKAWEKFAVMVTPPGAVHSHHNSGKERMRCLIVQDGALHYHARTMGFEFSAG